MLDDLVDHRPDGTQVIGATYTLGRPFAGGLLMALAAVVLLVVASMSTFTRITVIICLVFFGGGALFLGNAMLRNRPLIQWGSWGLAVFSGRKVAWSAVRSMQVVTVFGREYLAIWLKEPDASDPTVAPRMRRLRSVDREGHMTVPGGLLNGHSGELLSRLEAARKDATGDPANGA